MDDLVVVLESEKNEYDKLIGLSENLKDAVIEHAIEKVEAATDAQEAVTNNIVVLENRRKKILNDIALVLNKKADEITISDLLETLKDQPEVKDRLSNARNSLKETMESLRRRNDANQSLLKTAMELLDFDLNLYRSMRQAPSTANYNKSAENTGSLLGRGGFDAKQ
ncbi:MAG: flagellar protein FlgN [Lachnospiraceae bacterium]|nr:flagellar protein FlgN [Lachnospiraceae bacterium]